MDELAYALGVDPVELRRRNEPAIDEGENLPFSSRSLLKCFDRGSATLRLGSSGSDAARACATDAS